MSTLDTPTEAIADTRPGNAAARDPLADHLITPQNSALILIDYQPSQFAAVRSMDQDLLQKNIVSTVKVAKLFAVPIVHSTVNVASGRGKPTVPELAELLDDDPPIDRTTLNAWEDADFLNTIVLPVANAGGSRHRAAQADPLRPLDRDLHGLSRA